MADPDIRTGAVRCQAVWYLSRLGSVRSIWGIRLKNVVDDEDRSSNSLAYHMIRVMAPTLTPAPDIRHGSSNCQCILTACVSENLAICQDEPAKVVNLLARFDWPFILHHADFVTKDYPCGTLMLLDMAVFIGLHHWPVRCLVEDPNDERAKQFLKKLGSCVELFHRILRLIISDEIWSQGASGSRFEDFGVINKFLKDFMHCSAPLPSDRETDSLVRRARSSLLERYTMLLMNEVMFMEQNPEKTEIIISTTTLVLELMDEERSWRLLKNESPSNSWNRFSRNCLLIYDDPDIYKKRAETTKKNKQNHLKKKLTRGEMCANCFVLENDLQRKLLQCSRCRQIKYCSRDCQTDHWKKTHKMLCKKETTV
jgi:hypothetical protein